MYRENPLARSLEAIAVPPQGFEGVRFTYGFAETAEQ